MALWFEHWPGNHKVPGLMPSSISCCCCCFLEQETLLSLLQSTQLYKWENVSHQYCEELGDFSRRSSTWPGETGPRAPWREVIITRKKMIWVKVIILASLVASSWIDQPNCQVYLKES